MTLRLPLSLLLLGLVVGCAERPPAPDYSTRPAAGETARPIRGKPLFDPVQGKKRQPVEAPDAPAD